MFWDSLRSVRRSAFGVRRSAFGVWRSAFGVRQLFVLVVVLVLEKAALGL
jgi:hypothetical protein